MVETQVDRTYDCNDNRLGSHFDSSRCGEEERPMGYFRLWSPGHCRQLPQRMTKRKATTDVPCERCGRCDPSAVSARSRTDPVFLYSCRAGTRKPAALMRGVGLTNLRCVVRPPNHNRHDLRPRVPVKWPLQGWALPDGIGFQHASLGLHTGVIRAAPPPHSLWLSIRTAATSFRPSTSSSPCSPHQSLH